MHIMIRDYESERQLSITFVSKTYQMAYTRSFVAPISRTFFGSENRLNNIVIDHN